MYFARYVATVIGMSGGNGGLHIPNVYVNSPECPQALVYWRFSPRLCTRCAPCLRRHVVDAGAVLRVQLSAQMRAPEPDASLWTLEAVGTATPRGTLATVAAHTQLSIWLAGGRRRGHAADSAGRRIAHPEMISGCLPKTPHVTACGWSSFSSIVKARFRVMALNRDSGHVVPHGNRASEGLWRPVIVFRGQLHQTHKRHDAENAEYLVSVQWSPKSFPLVAPMFLDVVLGAFGH